MQRNFIPYFNVRTRRNPSLARWAFAIALVATGSASAQSADVAVQVQGPANAAAGDQVTYNVTIGNNGPNAADGTSYLVNSTPQQLQNLTYLNCNAVGGAGPCPQQGMAGAPPNGTIATMPANSVLTFQVSGTVPATNQQPLVFTVTANAPGVNDPAPGNNTAGTNTTVPVTLQQFDVD